MANQFSNKWERVSSAKPCEICGRPNHCVRTADFSLVGCMKIDFGPNYSHSKDTDGMGMMHFHRLKEDSSEWRNEREHETPAPLQPETPIADADTLNQLYSAFLAHLSLSNTHRDGLRARGLDDATIAANGYKSLGQSGRH